MAIPVLPRAFRETPEILGASGSDPGLHDGRSHTVEALVWLGLVTA
jgi:hypothetical protein